MNRPHHFFNTYAYRTDDSNDLAFEKKLIFIIALSCCLCGVFWSSVYYCVFGFGITAMLPVCFIAIVGSAIFISHKINHHRLLVYVLLLCTTWIPAFIQWTIGSIDLSGIVIVWSCLAPLIAVIFLPFRQSLLWIIMFLSIVVISVVFDPALLGEKLSVSASAKGLFYLMNVGVSCIIIYFATAWFVKTIKLERNKSDILAAKIKTLFGQHVSAEIANELISNQGNKDEGRVYDATIMFMDIRDFTLFADNRAPAEVVNFQNLVFSEYMAIVQEYRGTVIQLIGDGMFAVFGAPTANESHPSDAVDAGLAMIDKTKQLYNEGRIPEITLGLGLHTGTVIAGEIGSDSRKVYSVNGSNVIVASRIEQLNKQLKSQFLISEAVKNRLPDDHPPLTFQGEHELKGIARKVGIYQLV